MAWPFRKQRATGGGLTASAARIPTGASREERTEAQRLLARRQQWQPLCWDYFDTVPQVKYSMRFLGNALSRVRLFVGEMDPNDPDGEPSPVDDAGIQNLLAPLRGGAFGYADILRPLTINLEVPGECYLVGIAERTEVDAAGVEQITQPEEWSIRSSDEVTFREGRAELKRGPSDNQPIKLGDADFVARIWIPHPRWSQLPDSPVRGVMNACEELLMIERTVRATSRSRATGAGVLLLPSELSHGPQDPTTDDASDDPFLDELIEALVTPIQDEGHANAVVPLLLRGDAASLKEVRHLVLERTLDSGLADRTERALKTLSQGLELPVEVILGIADVNHWSAWQIEESTFKAHVEPLCLLECAALTTAYLIPRAKAAGVAPDRLERLVVWYDPTRLVIRPNRSDDAKWAHEHYLISDEAGRRELAFDDDDKPDDAEVARRIAQSQLRPMPVTNVDEPAPAQNPEIPEEAPAEGEAVEGSAALLAAARGPNVRNLGARLAGMDRELRRALQVAAEGYLRRALERIGMTLRRKVQGNREVRAVVASVPAMRVASHLGREVVAALGYDEQAVLDEAFEDLAPQFDEWVLGAQEGGLRLVPDLSDAEREAARDRMAADRAEAWQWFRSALIDLGAERIYDPNPEPPAEGEFTASAFVPFGIVREAVARAGGAMGEHAGTIQAAARRGIPTTHRALGAATGWLLRALFAKKQVVVEGYEWEYGAFPRTNPFEPHEMLDGEFVTDFDDERLANSDSFPPEPYYAPGDHDGCICDLVPVMGEAG